MQNPSSSPVNEPAGATTWLICPWPSLAILILTLDSSPISLSDRNFLRRITPLFPFPQYNQTDFNNPTRHPQSAFNCGTPSSSPSLPISFSTVQHPSILTRSRSLESAQLYDSQGMYGNYQEVTRPFGVRSLFFSPSPLSLFSLSGKKKFKATQPLDRFPDAERIWTRVLGWDGVCGKFLVMWLVSFL